MRYGSAERPLKRLVDPTKESRCNAMAGMDASTFHGRGDLGRNVRPIHIPLTVHMEAATVRSRLTFIRCDQVDPRGHP
jgi:hypothetical protein